MAIIDSQSVKTCYAGEDIGYDAGKKIKGRKRHIITDTQGNIIALQVHSASLQDRVGARENSTNFKLLDSLLDVQSELV